MLKYLIPLMILLAVITLPMPGRGPRSKRRDVWRGYKWAARDAVMSRANHRCEAAGFIVWGRCPDAAVEVDHVYPWSRGGPTTASNGQALCRRHNRAKAAGNPPWWYVAGLERRRRAYFAEGVDVRVFARYSAAEREARERWLAAQGQRGRRR